MEYPPPATKMLKKQTSPIKTGVFLLAIILLALIPSTAIPVAALDECEKLLATSQEECEAAGCNWCSKEDGINCDQICPCRKDCSAKKGYEDSCSYDSDCADGLFCSGTAAGKTSFLFAQACCHEGEVWDAEAQKCTDKIGVDDITNGLRMQAEDNSSGYISKFDETDEALPADTACKIGFCVNGDANCDGVADPGCETQSCKPSIEMCDLKDNDCDGVVDDGCKSQCGACGQGIFERCDAKECYNLGAGCTFKKQLFGLWNTCTETIERSPPECPPEKCNYIDDDCDSIVDEDNVCPLDINALTNFFEYYKEYHNKECYSDKECNGLACMRSRFYMSKGVCCMPGEEETRGGMCVEIKRQQVGEECAEDEECASNHCSKGLQFFWASIGNNLLPGKESEGICCPEGLEYDKIKKECIEGGTFSEEGSTDYCKERKEKGFVCMDGEGSCQSDSECLQGSYCWHSDQWRFPNICCPRGTVFDEYGSWECKETGIQPCYDPNKKKMNRQECLSRGSKCYYEESTQTCYERDGLLAHNWGPCTSNSDCDNLGQEELYCAVSDGKGACCYPWEWYAPERGACVLKCTDNFCDEDYDYYNSKIELVYGANPIMSEDTPWGRLAFNDCDGPFDYYKYTSQKQFVKTAGAVVDAVGGGLLATVISFVNAKFKQAFFSLGGNVVGFVTGAMYGFSDDVEFLYTLVGLIFGSVEKAVMATIPRDIQELRDLMISTVLTNPLLIIKVYTVLKDTMDTAQERNEEATPEFVDETVEQADSSVRNGIMEAAYGCSNTVDRGGWSECDSMTFTKVYTAGFMSGYFWEQVYLLGKIAKVLQGSAKAIIRVGGYVLEILDNPIFSKKTKFFVNEATIQKLTAKIEKQAFEGLVKKGSKYAGSALELTSIINGANWEKLTKSQFNDLLENFVNYKDFLVKLYEKNPAVLNQLTERLAKFIETDVGTSIFVKGYGKSWTQSTLFALMDLGDDTVEGFGKALKNANAQTVNRLGEELGNLIEEGSVNKKTLAIIFSQEHATNVIAYMQKGGKLQDYLVSEEIIESTAVAVFRKQIIEALGSAASKYTDDTIGVAALVLSTTGKKISKSEIEELVGSIDLLLKEGIDGAQIKGALSSVEEAVSAADALRIVKGVTWC